MRRRRKRRRRGHGWRLNGSGPAQTKTPPAGGSFARTQRRQSARIYSSGATLGRRSPGVRRTHLQPSHPAPAHALRALRHLRHARTRRPPDRPPRHGCVLRVGRAAALSGAARPAGGDRRRPPPPAGGGRRSGDRRGRRARFATLRDYAGRGVVTTATYEARALGVHSAHGPDEGGAARARRRPAAGRLRRVPPATRACSRPRCARSRRTSRTAASTRSTSTSPTSSPRGATRRGRASTRGGARATSRTAIKARGARRDRPVVLDRRHAEQAAREDRVRARQARRPHHARAGDIADAHLAAAGAQDQRHRPQGQRAARRARHPHASASSRAPTRRGCVEHFGTSYGAWMHEAAHGRDDRAGRHVQRAEVDQPRDDVRARPARGARPRRALGASSPSCATSSPATSRARATSARTIGLKLRFDDFKTVTRDRTLELPTQDAAAIRAAAGAA